ncbi:MAG TPA: AAC(3) family N-acetyltransferase, partial [Actinobacteria bacterium]|nr:AAC(3) family N-acetyltransferase [Actinomycetota bacterium]
MTSKTIHAQLVDLGVGEGNFLVHSSLSSLGYVLGGPQTFVRALLEAIGPSGTLLMPAFSPEVSDPASWTDRLIDPEDLPEARANVPAFDAAVTPTSMGAVAETFRTWP